MMINRRSILMIGTCLLMYTGCSQRQVDDSPKPMSPNIVADRCEMCHADIPPRDSATPEMIHYRHFKYTERSKRCDKCHLNYDTITGWTLDTLHSDGIHEPSFDTNQVQCKACHDYRDCWRCHSSPYTDPDKPDAAKIHRSHVVEHLDFKCDSCHKGYDLDNGIVPVKHDNGIVEVNFHVNNQGMIARYDAPTKTCRNLYCHGAAIIGGKQSVGINDKFSRTDSTRCSFCHNIDTLRVRAEFHSKPEHIRKKIFDDCQNCHVGYSVKLLATDSTTHMNGTIERIPPEKCNECHDADHQLPVPAR